MDDKRNLINLFLDQETISSPFSIHNFCRLAFEVYKKQPGDWFGGNETSIIAAVSFNLNQLETQFREKTICGL